MLIGDFCTVDPLLRQDERVSTRVHLNADHAIFQGHFPGQPVVPGVAMMQLVKEVLELALGYPLQLLSANQMKFLQFIDPRRQPSVELQVQYKSGSDGELSVVAVLQEDDTVFFKFNGRFRAS